MDAFASWDIRQYVYCNCLLTRLWHHKFWNWPYVSNQAVFSTWTKSQDKNSNILRKKKSFQSEIKSIFHHFSRGLIEAHKTFFLGWESDFKRSFLLTAFFGGAMCYAKFYVLLLLLLLLSLLLLFLYKKKVLLSHF